MYCENCGERVANSARFCQKCGIKLDYHETETFSKKGVKRAVARGKPSVAKGTHICHVCGTEIGKKDLFCSNCGIRVEENKSNLTLGKMLLLALRVLKFVIIPLGLILVLVVLTFLFPDVAILQPSEKIESVSETTSVAIETIDNSTIKSDTSSSFLTNSQEFLITLQETLKDRESNIHPDSSELRLIKQDVHKLEKYLSESFDDVLLRKLANNYVLGLKLQKESFDEKNIERQIKWMRGFIKRCEALSELYKNNYSTFDNVDNFEYIYVYQLDTHKEHYSALEDIRDDLYSQLNAFDWEPHNNYTMTHKFTNNTEYDFSATFYISYKDKDGLIYENVQEYYDHIPASRSIELEFYLPVDELPDDDKFYFDMEIDVMVSKFN